MKNKNIKLKIVLFVLAVIFYLAAASILFAYKITTPTIILSIIFFIIGTVFASFFLNKQIKSKDPFNK